MVETVSRGLLGSGLGMTEIGQPDSTHPTPDSRGFVSSRDFENVPGVPEPEVCEFCGATLYHKGIVIGERVLWTPVVTHCTCPEAVSAYEAAEAVREAREAAEREAEENRKLRERTKKIVGKSGMGERFLRRTFDTFQETPENRRALAACRKYAEDFGDLLPKRGQPEPGRDRCPREVKRCEQLRLTEWMNQAEHDAEKFGDGLPAVFHRRNREGWRVTMPLESWVQLYEKAQGCKCGGHCNHQKGD